MVVQVRNELTRVVFRYVTVLLGAFLVVSCGTQDPKRALRMSLAPDSGFEMIYESTLNASAGSAAVYRNVSFDVGPPDDEGAIPLTAHIKNWSNPFLPGMGSAMRGQTIGMAITPDGRVVSVEDVEALQEAVWEQAAPAARRAGLDKDLYTRAISEDALVAAFSHLFDVWPDVPVVPGDSWTREPIYHPGIEGVEDTTFTLRSWENGKAVIGFESTIAPVEGKASEVVEGDARGTIIVSPGLGMIDRVEEERTMVLDQANREDLLTLRGSTSVTFSVR